jgi:hypothetical protein
VLSRIAAPPHFLNSTVVSCFPFPRNELLAKRGEHGDGDGDGDGGADVAGAYGGQVVDLSGTSRCPRATCLREP